MGAREIAYSALLQQERSGRDASELLHGIFLDAEPSVSDRSLATELVYGCIRRRLTLRWLMHQYARFRLPLEAEIIIGIGAYQLLYLDRVPDYAAVSEAVRMAKAAGFARWASTVNALLRKIQAEREHLPWPSREGDLNRFLEVRHSHPAWLVRALVREHGPRAAEEILKTNNERPDLIIRCNTLRIAPRDLSEALAGEGIEVDPAGGSGLFFRIRADVAPSELEAFRRGLFTVQDVSAGLAVEILDPGPGESVLDLCAGPGGKTTYLAQLMGDRGEVIALDANAGKVRMIEESCRRMGIASVRCVEGDGRSAGALCGGRLFDKILVDAPCSNTGVLGRRVEARWRMNPSRIKALTALQLSLLGAAAERLKAGGVLVYSTCSVLEGENGSVAREFAAGFGGTLAHEVLKLPGCSSGDGVYCALFRAAPKKRQIKCRDMI